MNPSLNQALGRARDERPQALPPGFSTEVMARIARGPVDRLESVSRKVLVMAAGASVLVAAAVSLLTSSEREPVDRPSMAVFGVSGGSSLFGKR